MPGAAGKVWCKHVVWAVSCCGCSCVSWHVTEASAGRQAHSCSSDLHVMWWVSVGMADEGPGPVKACMCLGCVCRGWECEGVREAGGVSDGGRAMEGHGVWQLMSFDL